ncbi:hypothetical protein NXY56_003990 [Leishmania guyanensis]
MCPSPLFLVESVVVATWCYFSLPPLLSPVSLSVPLGLILENHLFQTFVEHLLTDTLHYHTTAHPLHHHKYAACLPEVRDR